MKESKDRHIKQCFGCAPKVGLAICKLPNEILCYYVIEKEEELVGYSIEPSAQAE